MRLASKGYIQLRPALFLFLVFNQFDVQFWSLTNTIHLSEYIKEGVESYSYIYCNKSFVQIMLCLPDSMALSGKQRLKISEESWIMGSQVTW